MSGWNMFTSTSLPVVCVAILSLHPSFFLLLNFPFNLLYLCDCLMSGIAKSISTQSNKNNKNKHVSLSPQYACATLTNLVRPRRLSVNIFSSLCIVSLLVILLWTDLNPSVPVSLLSLPPSSLPPPLPPVPPHLPSRLLSSPPSCLLHSSTSIFHHSASPPSACFLLLLLFPPSSLEHES